MSRAPIVLDASAALHLATMGSAWPGLARYELHAPPLMWSEALSGLAQASYRGDMPASALDTALERLEALPVITSEADHRHRRAALDISLELGLAKTYDAEYVALARSLGCPLLTIDRRLQRRAERLVETIEPAEI